MYIKSLKNIQKFHNPYETYRKHYLIKYHVKYECIRVYTFKFLPQHKVRTIFAYLVYTEFILV